jgi:ubiquinone/menaquinone biosynthesis C-methylase UbiE
MKTDNTQYIKALRFNWLTKYYDAIVSFTTREKTFKKKLIKYANLEDNDQVLDIGSGTGTLAILIKIANPNISVSGIDGDPEIIKIAENKSLKNKLKISFKQGLSFDMPFKDMQFDHCFSSLFFHHLTTKNKQKTFNEAYRVLKKGGQLNIADWGKPSNKLMRVLFFIVQLLDGFKTTKGNVDGVLPKLMEQAGFVEINIQDEISTMLGTMTIYSAVRPLN